MGEAFLFVRMNLSNGNLLTIKLFKCLQNHLKDYCDMGTNYNSLLLHNVTFSTFLNSFDQVSKYAPVFQIKSACPIQSPKKQGSV